MQKTIIILNPAARSEKAAGLCRKIEEFAGGNVVLRRTSKPGEARSIARQAIARGFKQIIAAGGDGTIHDVVNGMGGSSATLGILPMGTMNVFAAELGLPKDLKECWEVIQSGNTRVIDLPKAAGSVFVQMAGVGFDAQTLQETTWDAKRNLGPLSYVISAAQVAARKPPRLFVQAGEVSREGSFVLIGNGRYYGGPIPVFPNARIDDGLLDVIVFKKMGHLDIIRYLQGVFFGTHVGMNDVDYFQADTLTITSEEVVPVEMDGEVVGAVPVTFRCAPLHLRVLTP